MESVVGQPCQQVLGSRIGLAQMGTVERASHRLQGRCDRGKTVAGAGQQIRFFGTAEDKTAEGGVDVQGLDQAEMPDTTWVECGGGRKGCAVKARLALAHLAQKATRVAWQHGQPRCVARHQQVVGIRPAA